MLLDEAGNYHVYRWSLFCYVSLVPSCVALPLVCVYRKWFALHVEEKN